MCHRTIDPNNPLNQDELLEITALNISTKHFNTKNEMLDYVIHHLEQNKDIEF